VASFDFRKRLFLILTLFALMPAAILTVAWGTAAWQLLPFISAGAAWERVAQSTDDALAAARRAPLDSAQTRALDSHEQLVHTSLEQARRLDFIATRLAPVVALAAAGALGLVWVAASRVAGHFSRQLSRPIDQLVGWTQAIQRGEPLPSSPPARGAPEFDTLRQGMRQMASELQLGRQQAVEAERLRAFRETARRVAHELKNPLTPMQFAIATLRKRAPDDLQDTVRVLDEETGRLDRMARSFAQFGRMPDGPRSLVDVGELLRSTASACVPSHLAVTLVIPDTLPQLTADHDALQRAVMNLLLNAVDACGDTGAIVIEASTSDRLLHVAITDNGVGIPAAQLEQIWQPYVTTKRGGTGLGLALVQQTIVAHGGSVSAESTPERGTTIRFSLPWAPEPGADS
jgi:signal transduction histidine kinase